MNCPNCGAQNAPESKFCVGCGATMPAQPAQQSQSNAQTSQQGQQYAQSNSQQYAQPAQTATAPAAKKSSGFDFKEVLAQLGATLKPVTDKIKPLLANKLVVAGIAAGAALLLIIAIVCAIAGSGNGYINAKHSIDVKLSSENEYSIIVDGKALKETIDSEGYPSHTSSLDGSSAVILTDEGELYRVNGKKLKLLAEDVVSYKFSVEGDYVAYATREEDDETTTLMHCKLSNGKSNEITDELGGNYEISPDGKSVAYFVAGEESTELMLYKGKKSNEITDDENARLLGLSNKGKYIYVSITEKDESEDAKKPIETLLYVYNAKGDREKLETLGGSCYFNDDHTQVMFHNDEGKTYVSTKGKEANKVSSDALYLMAPNTVTGFISGEYTGTMTYPVTNMYNHVYQSDDSKETENGTKTGYKVWLIKKNSDKNIKLISNATRITMDDSAEYIYYVYDNEELRVAKISDGDKAIDRSKLIVDENVSYEVTSDRKYVYYKEDDTLYVVNGKKGGKAKELGDDLESAIYMNGKDVAFYLVDGDLYATKNGKKGKKVLSEIDSIDEYSTGLVLFENEDAVYSSTSSKKPKKILDLDI